MLLRTALKKLETAPRKLKELAGSTKPYLAEINGTKFVVKQDENPDRQANEWIANQLYQLFDIPVPKAYLAEYGDERLFLSHYREGAFSGKDDDLFFVAETICQGFVIDAWLANWDVIGLEDDNILIQDGFCWRVDHGGALRFRAQGSPKGNAFGDDVTELDSMRKPERRAARIFGLLSDEQIKEQIARYQAQFDAEKLKAIIEASGISEPEELLHKLLVRWDSILWWAAEH